jgi:hypothetical protein
MGTGRYHQARRARLSSSDFATRNPSGVRIRLVHKGPRVFAPEAAMICHGMVVGVVSAAALIGAIAAVHPGEQELRPDRRGRFEVSGSPLTPLSADDVTKRRPLLDFLKSIEAKSDEDVIMSIDGPVFAISSDVASKLFPEWRFYVVPFRMRKHPKSKTRVAIAEGLYSVLGVDSRGKTFEFYGSGNYDEFGRFLASQGARLRNLDEARQIWRAYCHVHRYGAPLLEPKEVTPTRWHLGVQLGPDREYYFEVRTSAEGAVQSFRLESRELRKKAGD